MHIEKNIVALASKASQKLGVKEIPEEQFVIQQTRKDQEGDYTLVCFPLARYFGQNPQRTAELLGEYIVEHSDIFGAYTVVKGFLNLSIAEESWKEIVPFLKMTPKHQKDHGRGQKIMVEFSSPNTNKPLHLGHVRNILLGWATTRIFEESGFEVIKTQIANDRGIAICKSMIAWKLFGEDQTPQSTRTKGDHFVGDYYVLFGEKLEEEYAQWQKGNTATALFRESEIQEEKQFFKSYKNNYFNEYSELGAQTKEMLIKWEQEDEEVRTLWTKMNGWVYEGFEETYKTLGVDFDHIYYESDTYKRGRDMVLQGVDRDEYIRKEDGSIWADLQEAGLDQKILLRSDGTSVYITQDMGTAEQRYEDHQSKRMVYVVANEQDYHFKVLFELLRLQGKPYAEGMYHLSYGMVDLPTGRMKTREGTVVDADDLLAEMHLKVQENSDEKGGLEDLTPEEKGKIHHQITLAALKFFILKVQAKKRMIFNPEESVDLQGHTGPYVQNAYVRICSVLRKYGTPTMEGHLGQFELNEAEKTILKTMLSWPQVLTEAREEYDPSVIAAFAYQLAKDLHRFYHESPILKADEAVRQFRLQLIEVVADYLEYSMNILGIEMPERM